MAGLIFLWQQEQVVPNLIGKPVRARRLRGRRRQIYEAEVVEPQLQPQEETAPPVSVEATAIPDEPKPGLPDSPQIETIPTAIPEATLLLNTLSIPASTAFLPENRDITNVTLPLLSELATKQAQEDAIESERRRQKRIDDDVEAILFFLLSDD